MAVTFQRSAACVAKWPECAEGEYHPDCCRFPKSCSCAVAVSLTDTRGDVALTMSREQAETCLAALLESPYRGNEDEQENVECFLIVQLRAALGQPMSGHHWMVKRAARV